MQYQEIEFTKQIIFCLVIPLTIVFIFSKKKKGRIFCSRRE